MLDVLAGMLEDMQEAADTRLALRGAKKDEQLNDYNSRAIDTTGRLIVKHPDDAKALLKLFVLTRNLERAGDLTKNIAEEMVFHLKPRLLSITNRIRDNGASGQNRLDGLHSRERKKV